MSSEHVFDLLLLLSYSTEPGVSQFLLQLFLKRQPLEISGMGFLQTGCTVFVDKRFLANATSRSRSLYVVACLSVVCNAPAPYSAGSNFPQCFYRHLMPWPSVDIQRECYRDCPRASSPSGRLNAKRVAKYSDFGHIEGYISEKAQDRR